MSDTKPVVIVTRFATMTITYEPGVCQGGDWHVLFTAWEESRWGTRTEVKGDFWRESMRSARNGSAHVAMAHCDTSWETSTGRAARMLDRAGEVRRMAMRESGWERVESVIAVHHHIDNAKREIGGAL